ncbi:MAG: YezD family protein [Armatimonadota bacterium]
MPKQTSRDTERRMQVALEEIRKALEGLQFGSLTVVVQDGIVVQIDKTAKNRIDYSSLDKVAGGEGI